MIGTYCMIKILFYNSYNFYHIMCDLANSVVSNFLVLWGVYHNRIWNWWNRYKKIIGITIELVHHPKINNNIISFDFFLPPHSHRSSWFWQSCNLLFNNPLLLRMWYDSCLIYNSILVLCLVPCCFWVKSVISVR